jgi:uncharacterized membrane protein YphA (DoxX/SURF4 family)
MSDELVSRLHDPARWLAVLRMVVGLWFVKSIWTKWVLLGGVVPIPVASTRWIESMSNIVTGYVERHPLPWYADFLEKVVLPNAELFATLTGIGEVELRKMKE